MVLQTLRWWRRSNTLFRRLRDASATSHNRCKNGDLSLPSTYLRSRNVERFDA